ncbi:MAG: hypothetical protein ACJ72N_11290 [Labedaea sp.]
MTASIFAHLEASLHQYLGEVAERARQADEQTAAAMARTELPRIAEALRAVLDEHEPDQHGRCPRCRARRFGRTPAPCRAYLSAHLCLLVAEDDPRPPDLLNVTADPRNRLDAPG